MKKFLKIFGISVALLLIAMIFVPVILKPKLVKLVKKEADKNITATLDFSNAGLNLFEKFPHVALKIKHLTLINKAPYAGDTLVHIPTLTSTLNLISLIRNNSVEVISLVLDEPLIHLKVLKDSSSNWNVIKPLEKQQSEPVTEARSLLKLRLRKYEIKNGTLLYDNQSSGLQVAVHHLEHQGSGDFTQDHFQLLTLTKIGELSAGTAEIKYLTQLKTQLKADLEVDTREKKLTLKESELQLNDWILSMSGFAIKSGDEVITDFKFQTSESDLKNFLSLIPDIYHHDFAAILTTGQASLQGYMKGIFKQDLYPAFQLQLAVKDGMFQYPNSPTQVNHINLNLTIQNPGGLLDSTILNLAKFHLAINREPLDATIKIKSPISDPFISATIKGNINLSDIKNIIPGEKVMDVAGFVTSDLFVEGNLSSLKKNQYDRYQAQGRLTFKEVNYRGPAMPVAVTVQQANLEFNSDKVRLDNFQGLLGKGDIYASGSLDDVWAYLFKGETLKGHLSIRSTFFDFNPWLESMSQPLTAIDVPANIDFISNSTFKEIVMGKLKLTNVSGILTLKDKMLHMIDLKMNVLQGSLIADGTYSKQKGTPAHAFFGLKMSDFSIGEAFKHSLTVQKFVPIAKDIEGNFAAELEFVTDLDSTLTPVIRTFNSTGSLQIEKLLLENVKPIDMLADILKMDKLKKLVIENVAPSYTIENGRLYLAPLMFTTDLSEFMIAGTYGIDRSIDYLLTLNIPAEAMNNRTNIVLNNIFNKKLDLLQQDHVVLDVSFKGTIDRPDVKVSANKIIDGTAVKLIDLAKQEILKQTVILPDTVTTEMNKQKQLLEKVKHHLAELWPKQIPGKNDPKSTR